jgi:hypothetical protein
MEELNCKTVRRALWEYPGGDYASGILSEEERAGIDLHLDDCGECVLHRGEVRSLRSGLRHLPSVGVPQILTTRLRVLASRERARRLVRRDFASWAEELRSRARLFFDNLLRPFAVPAAGGILMSCLCFGTLVGTLHVGPDWANDLPVGISSELAIDELSPFTCDGKDVMVQLSVDSEGNVTDYELPQAAHASPEELREIGNLVLYSTFSPAVRMGRRVASKRFFLIQHSSVKG